MMWETIPVLPLLIMTVCAFFFFAFRNVSHWLMQIDSLGFKLSRSCEYTTAFWNNHINLYCCRGKHSTHKSGIFSLQLCITICGIITLINGTNTVNKKKLTGSIKHLNTVCVLTVLKPTESLTQSHCNKVTDLQPRNLICKLHCQWLAAAAKYGSLL